MNGRQVLLSIVAVLLLCGCLVWMSGCAELAVIAGSAAGAAGAGGLTYAILNFPFTATICYYIGKEGALVIMPKASTAADKDVIIACDDVLVYLENAQGLPAEVVNQIITAKFSNLDPATIAGIQSYAAQLGQYVPSAGVILTQGEVNDIAGFVQGWRDGTNSVLGSSPASIANELAKTQKKRLECAAKRKARLFAVPASPGWFQFQAAKQ